MRHGGAMEGARGAAFVPGLAVERRASAYGMQADWVGHARLGAPHAAVWAGASKCTVSKLPQRRVRERRSSRSSRARIAPAVPCMAIDAVQIERPNRDTRVVKSGIRIAAPLSCVWDVLTAYNQLADVVPNLAVSRLVPAPNGIIRLEQCGVQKILGFEFQAAVTMDMTEQNKDNDNLRSIVFRLAASRDFKRFEGVWFLTKINDRFTKLNYEVLISPKGFVPVSAVEWRIKEDVPANLLAVKRACEALVAATMRQ
ncbi:hypothetical protein FVE85_0136 [Porphyridium purpureum]|uniref:Coenzyme Q-binding protein COQ10 START domain-containing protein n=1 Tax=Porphyridium purpureum TaxID=35688 RepID=A0A5J4Z149_PORPP|nr:hypothetical protein FVE85_0136 [Porphyridium purpureum]|eukprot:POR8445..scf208_2